MTNKDRRFIYFKYISYTFMSILIILLTVHYIVRTTSPVNASESIQLVSNSTQFYSALADDSITTIRIDGSFTLTTAPGVDGPLIISRPVTIEGGSLDLRCLGIVLGANVTFKDIELNLTSSESNVIAANGYSLTLINVTKSSSVLWSTHLTCGSLIGYNYSSLPATGAHGQIIIKGNCNLGNIYAGNHCHPNSSANSFNSRATITIDSSASGSIGNIYCHGGKESMGNGTGDIVTPGTDYSVSNSVNVYLYGSLVKNVYGTTGSTENAHIYYNGNDYLKTIMISNASSINVQSGKLSLASTSTLTNKTNISVVSGGTLYLDSMNSNLNINNFIGGGALVLKQNQSLYLSKCTNNTTVYIGGILYDNTSLSIPLENHTYITTSTGTATQFTFIEYAGNPSILPVFKQNGSGGSWIVLENYDDIIEVITAKLHNKTIDLNDGGSYNHISMTFDTTYTDNTTFPSLEFTWLDISINGVNLTKSLDEDDYYIYSSPDDNIALYVYEYSIGLFRAVGTSPLPVGSYNIRITVPAEYTKNNTDLTTTATLIITDSSKQPETTSGQKNTTESITTTTESITTTTESVTTTSEKVTTSEKRTSSESENTTSGQKNTTESVTTTTESVTTTTKSITTTESVTTTTESATTTTESVTITSEKITTSEKGTSSESENTTSGQKNTTESATTTTESKTTTYESVTTTYESITTTYDNVTTSENVTSSNIDDSSENTNSSNGSNLGSIIVTILVVCAIIAGIVIGFIYRNRR